MGWQPSEFWEATPYDFWRCFVGWRKKNGGKKQRNMNKEEYEALKEKLRKMGHEV